METISGAKIRADLVVIGASAGGVEAVTQLVRALPKNFPAAICIVIHIGNKRSYLPDVLRGTTHLPVAHALDGERIVRGRIYIAPPDFHMLVKPGFIRIVRGPKEENYRPAVNPLFRTAARAYRSRAMGVVLSGYLEDGSIGLKAVKHHGGVSVVQDPHEALVREMPRNAIRKDEVDYVLTISDIAALLSEFANYPGSTGEMEIPDVMVEPNIVEKSMQEIKQMVSSGKATALTCPECGGAIREESEEGVPNFRCQVGHAYSPELMSQLKSDNSEAALWNAVRILEEKDEVLRRMARQREGLESAVLKDELLKEAQAAKEQARLIRDLLYKQTEA